MFHVLLQCSPNFISFTGIPNTVVTNINTPTPCDRWGWSLWNWYYRCVAQLLQRILNAFHLVIFQCVYVLSLMCLLMLDSVSSIHTKGFLSLGKMHSQHTIFDGVSHSVATCLSLTCWILTLHSNTLAYFPLQTFIFHVIPYTLRLLCIWRT